MKLRWTKHCALSVLGSVNADNDDGYSSDNIIFTIKDKLYVPVVTLLAEGNQKLSKQKKEIENTTNEQKQLLESNFVGVNRLFVVVYFNRGNDIKRYSGKNYYLPKFIIKIVTPSSMKRTFMTNRLIVI